MYHNHVNHMLNKPCAVVFLMRITHHECCCWQIRILHFAAKNVSSYSLEVPQAYYQQHFNTNSHSIIMRFTAVLRATRRKPKPVIPILPPIPLYRRVLRANRKLDPDVRVLGDEYVKSEFRAHRTTDNPLYIVGFLTQWQVSNEPNRWYIYIYIYIMPAVAVVCLC